MSAAICGMRPKRSFWHLARTSLLIFCLIRSAISIEHDSACNEEDGSCPEPIHTVIRLTRRDDELARRIAAKHGMEVRGKPFLDSHYFLHETVKRSRRRKREAVMRLRDHPDVEWAEEQRPRRRVKRDFIHTDVRRAERDPVQSVTEFATPREVPVLPWRDPLYKEQWYLVGGAVGGYDMNVRQAWLLGYAGRNVSISILDDGIQKDHADLAVNYDPLASTDINDHDDDPTPQDNGDNKLVLCWFCDMEALVGGAVGGYDMNVRQAWLLGYAGRNVSISILDDGIQKDHADLAVNYDPLASTDINDHDDDPTPQDNGDNKHGTRCAGEVAAVAGNEHCGVGVAFHSSIGGVRMLDGPVSDSVEAASLSLNQDHIDIYSASWGPEDDGKTFDGPGPLAREAFYRGIKQGRHGKGNIFVWASGNGGSRQDSCSADGYTTSVYTLSISSATFDNRRPWYLEECPSSIATTYSSANMNQPAIVTVDVPHGCTRSHTGTSASAPLAAGIIALALEANPNLTWRDMQHVVLRTANPMPLLNNAGWSINGVGRHISNKFGYGLMDAGALVKLAKTWITVPEQHMCTYEYKLDKPSPRPLTGNFRMNFSLEVSGCESGTPVLYLEHVQVLATIRFGKRGDLKLTLFSPRGTTSVLLPPRPQDYNANGFHKWPFLSVQMWGEDPRGTWTLMVESVSTNKNIGGTFHDWSLLLYGTAEPAQPSDPRHPPGSPAMGGPSQTLLGRATERITSQHWRQPSWRPSGWRAVSWKRPAGNNRLVDGRWMKAHPPRQHSHARTSNRYGARQQSRMMPWS
ncbi:Endoprotease bli-4 [Toxocara canis]|uniref:Endoprotease bli-4 n=1 Tax=Toxocara canis TaxID=6265 RepID=A0A0B2US27_TOXCA|nr:Endoprotease bli-4 [Toxocara canis]